MAILKTKRNPYLFNLQKSIKKKENAFLVACSVPILPPSLAKLKICHKGGGN